MLNTEWTELEIIDLINEGAGLGFGIIGNKSTGVVVRTILASGAADRDQRLRAGDHIFHIGDVNVRGMTSDQVAGVLRQAGEHVRLLIGRPIRNPETESVPPGMGHYTQTVATYELDGHLQAIAAAVFSSNDLAEASHFLLSSSLGLNYSIHEDVSEVNYMPYSIGFVEVGQLQMPLNLVENSTEILQSITENLPNDVEYFDVILIKDETGLGITIAGYIGESSESHLNGIFVKSIIKGSAADLDGRIHVNDQIIEVNGQSLDGYTNHCAVDVLKEAGCRVHLKLARYHRGPVYEQLQRCTAHTPPPLRNSLAALNACNVPSKSMDGFNFDGGELSPDVELSIIAQWKQILGDDYEIIVAQISKFKERGGLGISLEGTVDVDNGVEVRPRHYIRSILPEGPVGINGRLKKLDELLEVNGKRLYGLNHVEVVHCLKELPQHVRLVVARRLGGILHSSMPCCSELSLFSGEEEESLGGVGSTAGSANRRLQNYKSRSLEPLYGGGLALWSAEPLAIQLEKQDRGLGFSILDYQDPQQSDRTVIVIRSLVPNGVAHCDRRLVPGDRLVFVNDINLERADLQQAVVALKSAPRGPVTLGVCKPLSSSLFHRQQASNNDNTRSTPQLSNNFTVIATAAAAASGSTTKEQPLPEVACELEMDLEHEDVEEPSRLQMPDLIPPLLIDLPNEMSFFKTNNNGYCAEAEPFANHMNNEESSTSVENYEDHQTDSCIDASITAEGSELLNELVLSSISQEVMNNNNNEDRYGDDCLKSGESSENVSSSLLDASFSSENSQTEADPRPSIPPSEADPLLSSPLSEAYQRPSTPLPEAGQTATDPQPSSPPSEADPLLSSLPSEAGERPSIPLSDADQTEANPRPSTLSSAVDLRPSIPSSATDPRSSTLSSEADQPEADPRLSTSSSVADQTEADPRLSTPSSEADLKPSILSSEADPRPSTPSSETDQPESDPRPLTPSSEADPRPSTPSSEADPQPSIPSTAADPRSSTPSSEADQPEADPQPSTPSTAAGQRPSTPSSEADQTEDNPRPSTPSSEADPRPSTASSMAGQGPSTPSSEADLRLSIPSSEAGQAEADQRPSTPQFDRSNAIHDVLQITSLGDPFDDARLVLHSTSMDLSSSISGFLLEDMLDKCDVEDEAMVRSAAVGLVSDVLDAARNALQFPSDSILEVVNELVNDVLLLALEHAERQHCSSLSASADNTVAADIQMQLVEQLVQEVLDEAVELLQQPQLAVRFRLPSLTNMVEELELQLSSSILSSSGSENSSVMSTSSLDCLEELEVIRDTGSDTDALLNYYKDIDEDDDDVDDDDGKNNDDTGYLLDCENGNGPAQDCQDDLIVRLNEMSSNLATIPSTLERSIEIIKHTDAIGLIVEAFHEGSNGCRIKKITAGSTLDMDGRLHEGDYITSMNNEALRHVSAVVIRDVIRRSMLSDLPIRVNYFSAADILSYQTADNTSSCETSEELFTECKAAESESLPNSSSTQSLHMAVNLNESIMSVSYSPSNCEDEVTSVDAEILPPAPSLREEKENDDDAADCVLDLPKSFNVKARQKNLLTDGSPAISDSSWGPAQHVTLHREIGQSLGISIVGGRVAGHSTDDSISGIFIKHVSEGSPAEREACLRTGDRILEVNGIDLRDATHDRAVEVIRGSGTTVHFTIQSLTDSACPNDLEDGSSIKKKHKATKHHGPFLPLGENNVSSCDASTNNMAHLVPCKKDKAFQVPKNIMCVKENICPPREPSLRPEEDNDLEDEFGYSTSLRSLRLKYADVKGELLLLDICKRSQPSLGLRLAGNKNHGVMSVYVCGIKPNGAAEVDGRLRIGDELLEINGHVLHGRSHVNAAPLINGCHTSIVKLIVSRKESNIEQMAVKPSISPQLLATSITDSSETSRLDITSLTNSTATPLPQHTYTSCGEKIYRLTLRKSKQGLGFAIMDGGFNDEIGIYVKSVSENGPAAEEGTLTKGDRLCEINGKDYTSAKYDDALDALRSVRDEVKLVVARGDAAAMENGEFNPPATPPPPPLATVSTHVTELELNCKVNDEVRSVDLHATLPTARAAVAECGIEQANMESQNRQTPSRPSSPMKETTLSAPKSVTISDDSGDPRTCTISSGKETLIEFLKGDSGLGLSIVGGCDTLLGAIIIHEVYKDGAAFKDGRLWAGDHVLEVNDSSLREVTHDHAIKVLRSTGAKVKILVFRDENPLTEEDLYDLETIELMKKQNKGLGISIVGRKNNEGVFVSAIVKGGAAESDGRLQPGDQILSINGEDMKKASQTEVATTLKSILGKTTLVVARLKSGTNNHDDFSFNLTASSNGTKKCGKGHSNSSKMTDDQPIVTACRRVELMHDASGSLGFSLVGGYGSSLGNVPCIVVDIIPNGSADRCGNLQIGDQILSMNGQNLRHEALKEVLEVLRSAVGSNIVLDVVEAPAFLVKAALRREHGSCLRPPKIKEIVLKPDRINGLGFTIVGGVGMPPPYDDMPIYVKNVMESGAAAVDGRLRRGDQIVGVNGENFNGLTREQAVSILKSLKGTTIRLQVVS